MYPASQNEIIRRQHITGTLNTLMSHRVSFQRVINQAAVPTAQHIELLSREPAAKPLATPLVPWRHADSVFAAASRNAFRRG